MCALEEQGDKRGEGTKENERDGVGAGECSCPPVAKNLEAGKAFTQPYVLLAHVVAVKLAVL